jgi:transcriptional regulator with XRE-family HTH domain
MGYTRQEQAILRAFGERVRAARKARGWTQEDLAYEAQLDRTYIGGIERGRRNIALLSLNRLAVALGEGFGDFFPFDPKRETKREPGRRRS